MVKLSATMKSVMLAFQPTLLRARLRVRVRIRVRVRVRVRGRGSG